MKKDTQLLPESLVEMILQGSLSLKSTLVNLFQCLGMNFLEKFGAYKIVWKQVSKTAFRFKIISTGTARIEIVYTSIPRRVPKVRSLETLLSKSTFILIFLRDYFL